MRIDDTGGPDGPDAQDPDEQDITRLLREGSVIGGDVDVDGAWAHGRRRRTRRRVATGAVAAAAVCAVLGLGYAAVSGSLVGGEDPVAPAASDTADPPAVSNEEEPGEVVDTRNAGPVGPEDVVEVAGSDGASATVSGVRFGRHEGFDRAVIELDDVTGTPGYRVAYAEPGAVLPGGVSDLPADRVLLIGLDVDPGDTEISPGHQDIIDGLGLVRAADVVGSDDGTLTLALGLPERYSYEVSYLEDPDRLVVDVLERAPGT